MVDEIAGVVNVVPVPREEPPVKTEYQLMVPAEAVASRETVPVAHRLSEDVLVMVGIAFTVAITADLEVVVHPLAVAAA